MRLTPDQQRVIRETAHELIGPAARVRLFGSRLDDSARGGDVDLLVDVPNPVDHPAWAAAKLATAISRRLLGRKVDVIIAAPNLRRLSIHDVAAREGVPL